MYSKTIIPFVCYSLFFVVPVYANPDSVMVQGEQGTPGTAFTALNPSAAETNVILSEHPADPPKQAAIAPEKVVPWEHMPQKSYLIPALEITGFLGLLNVYDRLAYPNQMQDGKKVYSSTPTSTWDHLRKQNWVFDQDPFNINQFAHPYQGATMYGLARSSGLGFWESLAYSNAGSFMWKMAGETDPPSINDQITTGNAGSLFGEALFRMAELVLKDGGSTPDGWHEAGAAIISPPTAFNRTAFGDRYKRIYPSLNPAIFWDFQLGSIVSSNTRTGATMNFAMAYGLPGKPGYTYTRPLDYFDFEISSQAKSSNPVNNVLLRGLLYGKDYHVGNDYRGIWGLYGSYDYLSPPVFRVSNTALSLGTTGQYWVWPGIALQGSLLGGVGFGAAGTTPTSEGDRDYHYGVAPQGLLALRLLFGDRAALELDARGYYVTGSGQFNSLSTSSNPVDSAGGSEKIVRIKTGFNFRVYGRHGLGLQYVESSRNSQYGGQPSRNQRDETISIVYTFVGRSHFGAVEWRDNVNL
ncbi:MAG: DUF3943 domain-containing protein [Desulfuromonadaceae bacterium]|nr:DUF3943 domain-containing protein [Desulfuromonadaceae bacterium]MDD5105830.1 DUF3943 domain-containing protein [Desulfuromonadaceae bacterium]